MSGFVYGDGTAFLFCRNFGFLFQSAYDTVYGIQEVLLFYKLLSVTGGNQGGFVADIGDIGTGETRSLAGQQFHVHRIVYLNGAQMYAEYFLTLVQVR